MILDLQVQCPKCNHKLGMKPLPKSKRAKEYGYTVYKCRNRYCEKHISLDDNGNRVIPPNKKTVSERVAFAMLADYGQLTLRELAQKYNFSVKTCCNVVNDPELARKYYAQLSPNRKTTRKDQSTQADKST